MRSHRQGSGPGAWREDPPRPTVHVVREARRVVVAGHDLKFADGLITELRARGRSETGLVASVGAGSGKQIAKIASGLAKPDGIRVVGRDVEMTLLTGLPVRRLWGIGPVAEDKLHRLGIDTVG